MGSSPIRDQTHVPSIGRWILYHCPIRDIPSFLSPPHLSFILDLPCPPPATSFYSSCVSPWNTLPPSSPRQHSARAQAVKEAVTRSPLQADAWRRWCSPRRGERGGGEAVLSVRDCLSHSSTGHWEHLRQDLMPWNSPGREEQGQGVRSALSEVFFFH